MIIFLPLLLLCVVVVVLVVVAYFKLLRRFSSRPISIFFGSLLGFMSFTAWAVIYQLPAHNCKLKILSYIQNDFNVGYWDLKIVERSPGEGELFDTGDNQAGAIAFESSRQLVFSTSADCIIQYHRINNVFGHSVPKDTRQPDPSWRCTTRNFGSEFHTYSILHNAKNDLYYLVYHWSFG